jgi:hypothetical protein
MKAKYFENFVLFFIVLTGIKLLFKPIDENILVDVEVTEKST